MPLNKTIWTQEQINYIKTNFGKVTAREMAAHLGVKIDNLRVQYGRMGLKAMVMEYWTLDQIEYLKVNFKTKGDVELADLFQEKWPKQKLWTKKHIEKKRNYLGLHRTKDEIAKIRWFNYHKGYMHAPSRFIDDQLAPEEGEVRMWKQASGRLIPRIKINGQFVDWGKYTWIKNNGPIPEGMNVVFIGEPTVLELSNLQLKSNNELAKDMYSKAINLDESYVIGMMARGNKELKEALKQAPALVQLKKSQLQLQRAIKNGRK